MNILYVVPRFPVASETFVAEEVIGVRDRGHNVTVAALVEPSPEQFKKMGIRLKAIADDTVYLPRIPLSLAALLVATCSEVRLLNSRLKQEASIKTFAVLRLLRATAVASLAHRVGAELIYAHWPRPTEVALLAGEISGLPVGISVHAHEVAYDYGHFKAAFERIIFAAFCNSAAMEYLLNGLPHAARMKAHLVYHGVDLAQFPEIRFPVVSDILHIVTAGRLTPTKGMERLIRAVGFARDRGVGVSLTVVGDGGQRSELEELTIRLNLREKIRFTGWVPHEEMRQHLSVAHVFALLADDTFHDGLPNVLLEAMALGRPAIITPLPAAAEVVVHGKNGHILSTVDSLDEFVECCANLLKNPIQLINWSSAASKAVQERHNRALQLDRLCNLFAESVKC